jgi:flagellar hook-associated protein 3 FlgL
MRITTRLARERRIADVLHGQERLEQARDRVSSGKRITRPSDSPGEIGDLLRTQESAAELQRRRDAADAWTPSMKAASSALQGMTDTLNEVRTMTLQAINSTTNDDQRKVLADQVDRLQARLMTLANTQVDGRYLFAGTNTDTQPFTAGPPVAYTGNNFPQEVSLTAGTPFAVSVTGQTLLNARGGTNLFANLSALSAAMRSGDTAGMSAALNELDVDRNNIIRQNGDMGARLQYVDLLRQQADENLTAAQQRQSQLQDVDLAEAIIDATTAEQAQQAALAMAGRLDQPSLLDYLR